MALNINDISRACGLRGEKWMLLMVFDGVGKQILAEKIIANRNFRWILQDSRVVSRTTRMIVPASNCHAGNGPANRTRLVFIR